MPGCAAFGCNNRSEKGYSMKCFPCNPELRNLWTERVCRADWEPSKNSFLCHAHFADNQWTTTRNGRRKLKRHAVPSIFDITSTRKSPRKRSRLVKLEIALDNEVDDYFYNYLDYSSFVSAPYVLQNQSTSTSLASEKHKKVMRNRNDENLKTVVERMENKVKLEMKSRVESDQDIDDIERKLRWICEGELQPDDKIKTEISDEIVNGKNSSFGGNCGKNNSSAKQNGKNDNERDNKKDTTMNARRNKRELTKDLEKIVDQADSINGIDVKEENREKSYGNATDPQESMFTIKVTGMDEDVCEIVKTLGTDTIYKYKIENPSTTDRNCYVTSVISVVDRLSSNNDDEALETKIPSSTMEARTDCNIRLIGCTEKRSLESSNNENSTNPENLRKKIKLQEEIIRTLTKQLVSNEKTDITMEKSSLKVDGKFLRPKRRALDDYDEEDNLLKDLSERLVRMNDINKNLNKRLTEKNQQTTKLELLIRQRNNRIRELNWKLERLTKIVERAEKSTNNCRKKMISMKTVVGRRKNREVRSSSKDAVQAETMDIEKSSDIAMDGCENGDLIDVDENVVYRTVQDIFDESNDCDDDPSVIDTREEFMREFEGAL